MTELTDAERGSRLAGIWNDLAHDFRPLGNGWPTYTVRFLLEEIDRLRAEKAAARREALLEAADAYYAIGRRFDPRTGKPECQCVQGDLNRPCYCDAYEWLRHRSEEKS